MTRYRAVVGCGPRGQCHDRGLVAHPERFALVAVCDVDAARREACAQLGSLERRRVDRSRCPGSVLPVRARLEAALG